MTTSFESAISQGMLIKGKWRGGRYLVHRLLGRGANGVVYLVEQVASRKLYALKMGFDTVDLQSEINVLTALHHKQANKKRREEQDLSYLVEVDDYTLQGKEVPFYVMRYVKGEPLKAFLTRNGRSCLGLTGFHLLNRLQSLHTEGWVFGDLKPENILVSPHGQVELIDYGGVSSKGRSVKQFTELYDRGYWNAGSRTADEAYDWFSTAMVCMHMLAGDEVMKAASQLPQTRSRGDLLSMISRDTRLRPYQKWLKTAIEGQFLDTAHACQSWKENVLRVTSQSRSSYSTPRWLKRAFMCSLLMLACALYWTLRL